MSNLLSQRLRGEAQPTKWNGEQMFSDKIASERVSYRCFDTVFSTKEITQRIKMADAPYLKLLSMDMPNSPRLLEAVLS
jgi:hypothetical protein